MIRGTPINLEFYIPVSDMEIGFFLQQNGNVPTKR